jgi:hypothetical protein
MAATYPTFEEMGAILPIQLDCEYSEMNHERCRAIFNIATTTKDKVALHDELNKFTSLEVLRACLKILRDYTPVGKNSHVFDLSYEIIGYRFKTMG